MYKTCKINNNLTKNQPSSFLLFSAYPSAFFLSKKPRLRFFAGELQSAQKTTFSDYYWCYQVLRKSVALTRSSVIRLFVYYCTHRQDSESFSQDYGKEYQQISIKKFRCVIFCYVRIFACFLMTRCVISGIENSKTYPRNNNQKIRAWR